MARLEALNRRWDLRAHLPRTSRGGSLLEVDAWIPSEVKAISPLVDRLMRLIEGSHCIIGEEHDVELALREALSNAVVHGNGQDARKLVHVRCRCNVGSGISLVVSDQGQGFDASAIPDSVSVENLAAEHGRGIQLMKWAMDEVSFKHRGTEVHMDYGITLKKSTTAPLMLIALYSPHGSRDANYLANYAYINLNDPIARLYGVGQTQVFGSGQYAMRLWVKPDQMAKLGITVTDIANALQAQNTVNLAGQVGGEPAQSNQQFAYAVLAQGRLTSPEQFGGVIVREAPDGGTVRVRDVARVELGTQDYSIVSRLNGKPSAAIAVYQLPGTNAVETVQGVRIVPAETPGEGD